jgi:thiamine-phosphate pyrophosphorylase
MGVEVRGPKIILVTDPGYTDERIVDVVEAATAAVPPGSLAVQLRDKIRDPAELGTFAAKLRTITRAKDAWLIVNGDARLAKEIGADGVHLGGRAMTIAEARTLLGPRAWISIAAHSDDAVRAAVAEGADAALVSPIFPTESPKSEMRVRVKEGGGPATAGSSLGDVKLPRGIDALQSARQIAGTKCLIYALGGVTSKNARDCVGAGADGVALIRGLLGSQDPAAEARALHDAVVRS